MSTAQPMTHHEECDCDQCALPRAKKPPTSLTRITWRLAMIWAGFRMIADLTRRISSALATPAAMALLVWILWHNH